MKARLESTPTALTALQRDALGIFEAAVQAANPYKNTCLALQEAKLSRCRFVLSIGKAAVPMLQAAYDTLGEENIQEAVLVTKYGHTGDFSAESCTCFEAGHPVSDDRSEQAARYVLQKTADLTENDTCLVLLSGGGSALFEASLIDKEEQRQLTDTLLRSGADIYALNAVRKRLSAVKGGRLAAHMAPARVLTFALSDVPGSRADVIASGPTQPDTVSDASFAEITAKYIPDKQTLFKQLPPRADLPADTHFCLVGDVTVLCAAAEREATARGYTVAHRSCDLQGDVHTATQQALDLVRQYRKTHRGKAAFLFGGETTVTVTGQGKGGRSQQAALCAALAIEKEENIVFLAGGSDGTDGPTDAAGGLADENTADRIRKKGLSPTHCLTQNDAYPALQAGGALLMTGPTGTNVNDIFIILTE